MCTLPHFTALALLLFPLSASALVAVPDQGMPVPYPIPVACTMEAKLCPDGVTYVGRQGPNCEFEACPSERSAPTFSDVPQNHPNADAIAYVKEEGIVEGYADGTYKPDVTINRAEFTKVLIASLVSEEEIHDCPLHGDFDSVFSDMRSNDWFTPYVCVSRLRGFLQGYPDGTLRPANPINFVEAAKILSLAFDIAAPGKAQGDAWYKPFVVSLERANAIPVSITGLDQAITRGEMADMIYRLKTGNQDAPSRTYDMLELRTVEATNEGLPFSLTYPGWWGDLSKQESYNADDYVAWGFTGLWSSPFFAHVIVVQDRDELQFTTKCTGYDCAFDTDFETYRRMFRPNRTLASGMKVEQVDSYSAPGGAFIRNANLFVGDAYCTVGGLAGFTMHDEEYERRVALGQQPSISEIVFEDISATDPHPMETVFALYPEKTVAEQRFFSQLNAVIGSIR